MTSTNSQNDVVVSPHSCIATASSITQKKRPRRTVEDDFTTTTTTFGPTQEDTVCTITVKQGEIQKANNSPVKQSKKRKHMDPNVLAFRMTIQQCCKINDVPTAWQAYESAVQNQTRIEACTFYNLLNLCDGSWSERDLHIGTPRPKMNNDHIHHKDIIEKSDDDDVCVNDDSLLETTILSTTTVTPTLQNDPIIVCDATRLGYAQQLQRHMQNLQLPMTENAYTALVRLYGRTGHFEQAQKVLQQAEATQQCKPKLRLYSPLLLGYCHSDQLFDAVQVWWRLSQQKLELSEREYGALLACATRVGDASVVERVLTDIAEDVLVPARSTTQSIQHWFTSSYAAPAMAHVVPTLKNEVTNLLQQITTPYRPETGTMGPVTNEAGWSISEACAVESETGRLLSGCLQGEFLQPVELSKVAWEEMKSMNENIAVTGKFSDNDVLIYQGGGKGRKKQVNDRELQRRNTYWAHFQTYLEECQNSKPVEILIDGANVGYFEQNFPGAPKHVDYSQIDWTVQHFVQLNKQVLVVMHSRHFSQGLMPQSAEPILQKWLNMGVLYRTPPGMNDDWFWLHAALYFGPGTLVVTNDEMRDHHFQMVAPRSFLRWRDRHQIHFDFGNWQKGDNNGNNSSLRKVLLHYPDLYSRRIQRIKDYGLVVPLPKQGDRNRFLDGSFEARGDEAIEEMYLCIRRKI